MHIASVNLGRPLPWLFKIEFSSVCGRRDSLLGVAGRTVTLLWLEEGGLGSPSWWGAVYPGDWLLVGISILFHLWLLSMHTDEQSQACPLRFADRKAFSHQGRYEELLPNGAWGLFISILIDFFHPHLFNDIHKPRGAAAGMSGLSSCDGAGTS